MILSGILKGLYLLLLIDYLMDIYSFMKRFNKEPTRAVPVKQKEYVGTLVVTCPHCDFEHPDSPMQPGNILCGNCFKAFSLQIISTATGKRRQGLNHDHAEYLKKYTTKPVKVLEKKAIPDIETAEEANRQYLGGFITAEEYKSLALTKGWTFWNLNTDRNPFSPEGNNKSRERGAIYNCSKHPKGIIFQHVIKESIRKFIDFGYGAMRAIAGKDKSGVFKRFMIKQMLKLAPQTIDFANSMMTTHYDKDAFVFDDPFLTAIRDLADEHISKNFQWDYPWVDERMRKGVDMSLAHLKEDIPYRAKTKLFLNDLIKRYPSGFPLTDSEIEINILTNNTAERRKRGEKYRGIKPSFIK